MTTLAARNAHLLFWIGAIATWGALILTWAGRG